MRICFSLAAVLGLTACQGRGCEPEAASPPVRPAPTPLVVQLGGCAAVVHHPASGAPPRTVCEVSAGQRRLGLWLASSVGKLHARWTPLAGEAPDASSGASGEALSVTVKAVGGGQLLRVEVPLAAGRLALHSDGGGSWQQRVRPLPRVPRLEAASALRRKGRLPRALAQLPSADELPPRLRGRLWSLRARLLRASGRAAEAIPLLRRSMAHHRSHGRVSDEVLDGMMLIFVLLRQGHRFSEARAVLVALRRPLRHWDEGRARIGYYRAVLARASGDLRAALLHLRRTEQRTERLGLVQIRANVRQLMAVLLQALGRNREAVVQLAGLDRAALAKTRPCFYGQLLNNLAWVELLARESRQPSPVAAGAGARMDPRRLLQQAQEVFRHRCPRPRSLLNARVNLALDALQQGQLEQAAAHLVTARAMKVKPGVKIRVWLLELEGRVALGRGRAAAALSLYRELEARARAAGSAAALWRALVGRGRAQEAAGDLQEALGSYRAAELLLDSQTLRVPVGEGRMSFLVDRERGARLLVDLLVRLKRPALALVAARRSQARALASIHRLDRLSRLTAPQRARWDRAVASYRRLSDALERDRASVWQLSADKLPAVRASLDEREEQRRAALDRALALFPARRREQLAGPASRPPGELLLSYHPATAPGRWWGFASDGRGVTVAAVQLPDRRAASAGALSTALLAPFATRLRAARRVRLQLHRSLQQIDLHALPLDQRPLQFVAPVVHGADLPAIPASPVAAGRGAALVVADPRGDLHQARQEARLVSRLLRQRWEVTSLSGSRATAPAVRQALRGARLFHFAGHGHVAGPGGWDSGLRLAGGTLSPGDILALEAVPPLVVLSGCDTGRGAAGHQGAGISLAQAFLAAGARVVVATSRPVSDRLARALGQALYKGVGRQGWDLAQALSRAAAQLQAAGHQRWPAYRVYVR